MNKTKQEQIEECKNMTAAWIIVVVAFIVALCVGCKSVEYVTVPEYHTDTVRVNHLVHDSINVHDSIFVALNGDTIRIERWHTKYIEREVHDTTYIAKVDSVPVPYEVTKYVEKKLSTPVSILMTIGMMAVLAAFIALAVWLKKILRL